MPLVLIGLTVLAFVLLALLIVVMESGRKDSFNTSEDILEDEELDSPESSRSGSTMSPGPPPPSRSRRVGSPYGSDSTTSYGPTLMGFPGSSTSSDSSGSSPGGSSGGSSGGISGGSCGDSGGGGDGG